MSTKITQKEFGCRLKQVRNRLGFSQKDFAAKLKLAVSTYQHYERGEREAPISILPQITAFGVSIDWLLSGNCSCSEQQDVDLPFYVPQTTSSMTELQHMNLVKGFINKQCALDIDRELLELEKLEPEALRRVESYIKGMVDMAKAAVKRTTYQGLERRMAQRRLKDDPTLAPDGIERRSGEDRRKAV